MGISCYAVDVGLSGELELGNQEKNTRLVEMAGEEEQHYHLNDSH